jgi:hypothetical protein
MQVFDGFIAAIASEFKMKFHKVEDGIYRTVLEFEDNRKQEVVISLDHDESGDRVISCVSTIAKVKADHSELFKYALKLNATIDYCAIALKNETLVLKNTLLLEDCDPHQFMKALIYVAAKADELEEMLTQKDEA